MTLLPQTLINLKTKNAAFLVSAPRVLDAVDALNRTLIGAGRVLLRPSGTEPLLRVMVEGNDPLAVRGYAQQLSDEITHIEQQMNMA